MARQPTLDEEVSQRRCLMHNRGLQGLCMQKQLTVVSTEVASTHTVGTVPSRFAQVHACVAQTPLHVCHLVNASISVHVTHTEHRWPLQLAPAKVFMYYTQALNIDTALMLCRTVPWQHTFSCLFTKATHFAHHGAASGLHKAGGLKFSPVHPAASPQASAAFAHAAQLSLHVA